MTIGSNIKYEYAFFLLSIYFIDLFKWMGYPFTYTPETVQSVISGAHLIESIRIVRLRMMSKRKKETEFG